MTVSTATLSDNEKVVTLDLATPLDGDYVVTVLPIESKDDATVTTILYTKNISFKDTVKPTVVSTTYPIAGQAVIQMSEELDTTTLTGVTIDRVDGEAIGSTMISIDPKDSSKFEVKSIEANKEYKVTMLGVKDVAGNVISPNPTYVTVKSTLVDTEKPVIENVVTDGLNGVIVTFSEEVDPATIKLDLDGTNDATITATPNPKNKLEVKIAFTTPLLTGGVHSVKIYNFKDLAIPANTGDALTKNLQFAAAAAKLNKTTVAADNSKVTFTFDMNVTAGSPLSLTHVDSDMVTNTVSLGTGVATGKELVYTYAFTPGKYTGEFTSTEVTPLGTEDKIAISFEVKEAVDSEKATPTLGTIDNENVVVNYDKDMGASALDVSNYKVEGKNVFKEAIFDGNAKKVKLTFKPETIKMDGDYEFTIDSAVKTKAGVAIDAFAKVATFKENVAPTVEKIEFTAPDTVTITFSENVNAAANFAIVKVDGAEDATKFGVVTNAKTATMTLSTAVTDLTKPITVEFDETIDVTDTNGNKLVPAASYTVTK